MRHHDGARDGYPQTVIHITEERFFQLHDSLSLLLKGMNEEHQKINRKL